MIRKLRRYIEREFGNGPYEHKWDGKDHWMFKNAMGTVYGIREYDKHLVLFNLTTKEPQVICKLTKGKKIRRILK